MRVELEGQPLSVAVQCAVSRDRVIVDLSEGARERMQASRACVQRIVEAGRTAYGINTGFGDLADRAIPFDKVRELQLNLVRSHACGFGEPLEGDEARLLTLLRANVLAKGLSGARPEVVDRLCAMLNDGIYPYIPSRGSVGASGDLAPLAHLALVLIGEGKVGNNGDWIPNPMERFPLEAKEGLALLNGTQAIGSVGGLALDRGLRVVRHATLAAAMSLEALLGTPEPFDPRIHAARPHRGQSAVAAMLTAVLAGSDIRESHRMEDTRVQDAYCLRCTPQVHGAVWDALSHAVSVLELESGSATDNPLVFADASEILSGGNFHGAPLAMVLDYAGLSLASLMAMSERRMERMINAKYSYGLPPFLARDAGLQSGFMILHVAAVAALNEARVLSHPASADNTPTSANQEDHVSMGMTAAIKLKQIVRLAEQVVGAELMVAAEGIEHRRPLKSSPVVEVVHEAIRGLVAPLTEDRPLGEDATRLAEAIRGDTLGVRDPLGFV